MAVCPVNKVGWRRVSEWFLKTQTKAGLPWPELWVSDGCFGGEETSLEGLRRLLASGFREFMKEGLGPRCLGLQGAFMHLALLIAQFHLCSQRRGKTGSVPLHPVSAPTATCAPNLPITNTRSGSPAPSQMPLQMGTERPYLPLVFPSSSRTFQKLWGVNFFLLPSNLKPWDGVLHVITSRQT